MTTQLRLLTSTGTFDRLHELADGRKTMLKINREELMNLLIDHSALLGAVQRSSAFAVSEPMRRQRVRLNEAT